MSGHDDDPGRDDPFDLDGWDETVLEEGEELAAERTLPVDAELRRAVLEQRLVHGLLAQRYDTVAAKDARVRSIVAALPAAPSGAGPVIPFWRRFGVALAAAAAVLVSAAALMWGGSDVEKVEKLWAQAKDHLDDEVDRQFTLDVFRELPNGDLEPTGHHVFTVRPGGMFRVEMNGEAVGVKTVGCDGVEVWLEDRTGGGKPKRTHDVREKVREFFEKELLGAEGFFDVGYLSLESVLDEVHEAATMFEHDVEPLEPGGRACAHILGEGNFDMGKTDLEKIEIWFDQDTSMIRKVLLDLHDERSTVDYHFHFKYVGVVPTEPGFYSRPR